MQAQQANSLALLKVLTASEAFTQVALCALMLTGVIQPADAEPSDPMISIVILLVGVLSLGAAPVLGRTVNQLNRRSPGEVPTPDSDSLKPGTEVFGHCLKVVIFGMAGIFGFVSYMLGGQLMWAVGLAVASLLAILSAWPRS